MSHIFKHFDITVSGVKDSNTFSNGDTVAGEISFDLTEATKISSIIMHLKGEAAVQWSSGGGWSRPKTFSATKELLHLKHVIMQEDNSRTGGSVKLEPGTHKYPFSCQLPDGNFPSSFSGVYGHVVYNLTVDINRPWHMKQDFVTDLNIVNRTNINQPHLQAPLSGSNQMKVCSLWCTHHPVSVTANLEKRAFIPGETVTITCEFNNGLSETAIPKVRLLQKQYFSIPDNVNKRMAYKTLESVTGRPISARTSLADTEIMLAIPSSAALSISNCSILMVEYIIEVSLSGYAAPDIMVHLPIILCEPLVGSQPPLDL